jgi:DNA topoisomerase VI subunit B
MVYTPSCNGNSQAPVLSRTTFTTSRLLDFFSEKELIAQSGHRKSDWPLVVLKELLDNALDACEEARVPPHVHVRVDDDGITVSDNGAGMPAATVAGILDFSVRVSSREAYVSPCRGAQGNALKTLLAMPFVLDGSEGCVEIAACGIRHAISMKVDRIRQEPVINHQPIQADGTTGTLVRVHWPDTELPRLILDDARSRFLQIADDYTFLNPHLTLAVEWRGRRTQVNASRPEWAKWLPSNPTSAHWYSHEQLGRLIAAYVAHDADHGKDRTVREFISEFRGLSGTTKQTRVLDATGLKRTRLSELAGGGDLDVARIGRLLGAMREHSRPVKAKELGVIGKEHLSARLQSLDADMDTFNYYLASDKTDEGLPVVVETAFALCERAKCRRLVSGVNWSPGIINPFRTLGKIGLSLDSILEQQRVGSNEPVVYALHVSCPRVQYTDRGKSTAVIN